MRKVPKIIFVCLLITITLSIISILNSKEEKVLDNEDKNLNTNFISMMVEQEDGSYKENTDVNFVNDGYMFNEEKSGCENGGILSWNSKKKKVEVSLLTSDKCYAYFEKYNFKKSCQQGYEDNLECDILKGKDNTLIYHDGNCDYEGEENCSLEAEDNSYRYTGANPNNYICFGGECSNDSNNDNYANLYRIIGLFDDNKDGYYNLKIIKADYATEKELGTDGSYIGLYEQISNHNNNYYKGDKDIYYKKIDAYRWTTVQWAVAYWGQSNLNKTNLNEYFLNEYLLKKENSKWNDMIDNHTWIIAGNSGDKLMGYLWDNEIGSTFYDGQNAKTAYNFEIIEYDVGTELLKWVQANDTLDNSVGLMYLSDYYYGAASNYWSKSGSSKDGNDYRTAINDNWLCLGLSEWTISRENSSAYSAVSIASIGAPSFGGYGSECAIRPVMYLKHNIKRVSGNGTIDNPYQITN